MNSYNLKTVIIIIFTSILFSQCTSKENVEDKIIIGIVSDVHADMLPDGAERMKKFISEAENNKADMIVQLGDFCRPNDNEKFMLDLWNTFPGDKYHVLGNHDMDFNTKDEVIKFWDIPSNYFSFDKGEFHFIVLDANYLYQEGKYVDYRNANFYVKNEQRAYINPEQIVWLKNDLRQTDKRTIIFSHQSLINILWGIKNRIKIQEILENANKQAGYKKVIACFNGHDHVDFHREINGIHYFEINGLGYQWMGEGYADSTCFDQEQLSNYPHLDKIAIYKDPLYTFATISNNKIIVKGIKSEWVCKSPSEKGIPEMVYGCKYTPVISDHEIKL